MIYIPSTIKREYLTVPNESTRMRQHKLERGRVIAAETDGQINRRINDGVDMGKLDHLAPAQRDSARIQMKERSAIYALEQRPDPFDNPY